MAARRDRHAGRAAAIVLMFADIILFG